MVPVLTELMDPQHMKSVKNVHIHIHVYVHVHVYVHIHIHIHVYVYVYVYVHTKIFEEYKFHLFLYLTVFR